MGQCWQRGARTRQSACGTLPVASRSVSLIRLKAPLGLFRSAQMVKSLLVHMMTQYNCGRSLPGSTFIAYERRQGEFGPWRSTMSHGFLPQEVKAMLLYS